MDGRTRPQVSHNLLGKPLRGDAPRLTTATWKTRAFGLGFPQLRSRYDDESLSFGKNAERGLTAYRGTRGERASISERRVESTNHISLQRQSNDGPRCFSTHQTHIPRCRHADIRFVGR